MCWKWQGLLLRLDTIKACFTMRLNGLWIQNDAYILSTLVNIIGKAYVKITQRERRGSLLLLITFASYCNFETWNESVGASELLTGWDNSGVDPMIESGCGFEFSAHHSLGPHTSSCISIKSTCGNFSMPKNMSHELSRIRQLLVFSFGSSLFIFLKIPWCFKVQLTCELLFWLISFYDMS